METINYAIAGIGDNRKYYFTIDPASGHDIWTDSSEALLFWNYNGALPYLNILANKREFLAEKISESYVLRRLFFSQ